MMTFSDGLSSLMYSSNSMDIFFRLLLVAFGSGVARTNFGGVSSYGPPSGCPVLAHA